MVISFARDIFVPLDDVVADDTTLWTDVNGRRLSDRVWLAGQETRRQIDNRLRLAIARGDDPIQVARELEQFLDPSLSLVRDERTGRLKPPAKQPKGARTTMPRGGAGSAPARRLARTEISRAFEQASQQASELNPFVDRRKYNISGAHKKADDCDRLAHGSSRGQESGVYLLSEFPSPPRHPHCLCYGAPVVVDDQDAVIAQLRRDFDPDPQPIRLIGLPQPSRARSLVTTLFRVARQLLGREAA